MKDKGSVHQVEPSSEATLTLPDGSVWGAPSGTPLEAYFRAAHPELIPQLQPRNIDQCESIMAAIVDGSLRELSYPLFKDSDARPVLLSHSDGLRIYRRALSMLLLTAARELYPARSIRIDHSLPFGGYYCEVIKGRPFNAQELERIKARMREIVDADERITRQEMPLDEAIAMFKAQGDADKLRLLKSRRKKYLTVYTLRGFSDYFYGYMVPSAGYLQMFDLSVDGEGFILHYPHEGSGEIRPISNMPKLRKVFLEAARWLELLEIEDIGALNEGIRNGRARELILVAEALHESSYADIADAIVERWQHGARLVLLAGPSSAGKTTSSKRLAIQLQAHGLKPFPMEIDNYFVDREKTPYDAYGEYDFEHLLAIDLAMLNDHLLRLTNGERVQLPRFNFVKGRQEKGESVRLTPEHVIIMEGIHALNPQLISDVPTERAFRIFVSCITQLNIDRHNRVPTTDVRLLRRIVRDAAYRGHDAQATLARWQSVRAGERKWIYPYQENADVFFNSALVYELAVLRPLAEPLLRQVEPLSPYYMEAKRLLAFLNWVEPLAFEGLVPSNSVLREFTGGGILEQYRPGSGEESSA